MRIYLRITAKFTYFKIDTAKYLKVKATEVTWPATSYLNNLQRCQLTNKAEKGQNSALWWGVGLFTLFAFFALNIFTFFSSTLEYIYLILTYFKHILSIKFFKLSLSLSLSLSFSRILNRLYWHLSCGFGRSGTLSACNHHSVFIVH